MTQPVLTLGFAFLFLLASPSDFAAIPASRIPAECNPICDLLSLPAEMRNRLETNFNSWRPLDQATFSGYARKTWTEQKPRVCPGIAIGLFRDDKSPSECCSERGSSDYFVRTLALDKTFAGAARKRLQTEAPDGITLIEWSEREYGTGVYFWSKGKFHPRHIDEKQKRQRNRS